ncbi:putative thiol-disulfide isomerase/thioredoxins-like; putative signal peptide [Bradyrhizobium sp. ORS 285]|uniref:TlpA family protein disulfide reductase n=1 Tax=Bradyrhizobium sp. ORS 285 TaxID=115808 RepID=UPI000551FFAD|nr:TlpA disulfide reductase family protein [Bradyrhizobium sp. ORS 285]SMX58225.1 putative thiol-disulfide isomerase/thioredoxins-like; putative signal peptide [Bradyrhizobium sp. ORS 285]
MKREILVAIALCGLLALTASGTAAPQPLKPFERGTWHELLRAHAGRPTLIHFWGVTCGPCKIELPQLGKFMADHPGIDVVTVSADLVPNLTTATQAMLDKAGLAAAENFIFNDGFVERLRFEIDPSWQGDIPRTMLVTPDGAIETIEGSAEISDLDQWSAKQRRQQ